MTGVLVGYAAQGCVAAGLLAGVVTLALGRDLRAALRLALDFWLAAGMLRLTVATDWQPLIVAAAIIAIRQLVAVSLHRPAVRWTGSVPGPADREYGGR